MNKDINLEQIDQEVQKRIKIAEAERYLRDLEASSNRARAVSVGTGFGGVTEVSMRADDGRVIWAILQPVEVVELIHQLSSNVGCHLALKPREDFSSWRDWRVTDGDKLALNGFAPFSNDMAPFTQIGKQKVDQEQLEALKIEKPKETGGGIGGLTLSPDLPEGGDAGDGPLEYVAKKLKNKKIQANKKTVIDSE